MAKKGRELSEDEKTIIKRIDTAFIPTLAKVFGVSSATVSGILAQFRHPESFKKPKKHKVASPAS